MEDVGCVRVQVVAREFLCPLLRYVAGMVEWMVGVFVFAGSARFVHAVADCDSCSVWAGQVGVVVNNHWGMCLGSHATVGLGSVW